MDNNKDNSREFNVNISAGNNKIKYYKSNDNNCIFEILDNKENVSSQGASRVENSNSILNDNLLNKSKKTQDDYCDSGNDAYKMKTRCKENYGTIRVTSILDCGEQEYLQGVKINLYKINGLSPVLIDSQISDTQGNAVFSQVPEGCYRVIELIDKHYFDKPKYIKWNEITIDDNNRNEEVIVINKIKKNVAKSKYI